MRFENLKEAPAYLDRWEERCVSIGIAAAYIWRLDERKPNPQVLIEHNNQTPMGPECPLGAFRKYLQR
jgi:hypothetical protein